MQRFLQIIQQIIRILRPTPGIFLFFIAPLVGILLTGLTPPNGFFNPLTLLFLCVLYGGGAIIARELMLYWGKGWITLLLLGAAFGVIEEGLRLKSFFDPHWKYLGQLGTYGRLWDVNWVWSVQMTLVHAVFSIAIPVLIVNLLFPKRRMERWAGPRALLLLIVMFILFVVLGFLFLSSYHPPFIPYLVTLVVAATLILLARFLPRRIRRYEKHLCHATVTFWACRLPGYVNPVPYQLDIAYHAHAILGSHPPDALARPCHHLCHPAHVGQRRWLDRTPPDCPCLWFPCLLYSHGSHHRVYATPARPIRPHLRRPHRRRTALSAQPTHP